MDVQSERRDDEDHAIGDGDKKRFIGNSLFCLNAILLALIVRLPWMSFTTHDFHHHLNPWYEFIVNNGILGLKDDLWNQNVPYLYLLSLSALLFPSSAVLGIKVISIVFDFLLSFLVYKCVRLKYSKHRDGSHTHTPSGISYSPRSHSNIERYRLGRGR